MKTEDKKVKWLTLENFDATRVLKQHGFVPRECKEQFTGDKYPGNKSLCKRVWCSEDGEYAQDWEAIDNQETLNEDRSKVCKTCLKLYEKL